MYITPDHIVGEVWFHHQELGIDLKLRHKIQKHCFKSRTTVHRMSPRQHNSKAWHMGTDIIFGKAMICHAVSIKTAKILLPLVCSFQAAHLWYQSTGSLYQHYMYHSNRGSDPDAEEQRGDANKDHRRRRKITIPCKALKHYPWHWKCIEHYGIELFSLCATWVWAVQA